MNLDDFQEGQSGLPKEIDAAIKRLKGDEAAAENTETTILHTPTAPLAFGR